MIFGGSIGAGATIADINPATAFAADYFYCGQLVPAQTECPDKVYSMPAQGNRATYPGSGVVSVCEKAVRASSGAILSRRCANGTVASGSDLPNGPSTTCSVGNNDNGRHTVNGKAVTL